MEKNIYLIYECNEHREVSSYCIKGIYTNKRKALIAYNKASKEYLKDPTHGWILNVSAYDELNTCKLHKNILKDLSPIFCTE